jgi:hypothetical protein
MVKRRCNVLGLNVIWVVEPQVRCLRHLLLPAGSSLRKTHISESSRSPRRLTMSVSRESSVALVSLNLAVPQPDTKQRPVLDQPFPGIVSQLVRKAICRTGPYNSNRIDRHFDPPIRPLGPANQPLQRERGGRRSFSETHEIKTFYLGAGRGGQSSVAHSEPVFANVEIYICPFVAF